MTELEQDPIDWEAKFHKAVSANVRQSDEHKRKSAQTLLDLQAAKAEIIKLEAKIKSLEPAEGRRAAMETQLIESDRKWHERVNELKAQVKDLNTRRGKGQRAILEDVVSYLQNQINRLPKEQTPDA